MSTHAGYVSTTEEYIRALYLSVQAYLPFGDGNLGGLGSTRGGPKPIVAVNLSGNLWRGFLDGCSTGPSYPLPSWIPMPTPIHTTNNCIFRGRGKMGAVLRIQPS